ncbi:MAG: ribonuclease III [Bacteroidales bacterium]|jgi:ribonuclease-3|nr:ribonuclease III [Bacteroidales bacterium]
MVKDKEFYSFLRRQLNIRPGNIQLYELAFLHRSASITLNDGTIVNNERLEYLGDAVIDSIIADYLFRHFPKEREGFLTQMRSKIVNRTHLDSIAAKMGLVKVLIANAKKETIKKRICGDAFEALIGAMYLDKGYPKTKKYFIGYVLKYYVDLDHLLHTETDFKSRLIEWGQKYKLQIGFEATEEYLETNSSPGFSVQVTIGGVPIAMGKGHSKKEAEQEASKNTLTYISTSTEFSTDALSMYLERISEP